MQKTEELKTLLDRDLYSLVSTEVLAVSSALHRVLKKVNAYANTFAPINRLPVELLGEIFKYLIPSSDDPPCLESPKTYFERRDVLAVIHVCELWHNVAVGLPALWNHIDLDARGCSPAFIQRTDQLPLSFHFSLNKPELPLKLQLLGKHRERVRNLYLTRGLGSGPLVPLIDPALWYIPQQLECLVISLAGRGVAGTTFIRHVLENIPKTQLKALAIKSSTYDLISLPGPMTSLTHFCLTIPNPHGVAAPMRYFLDLLSNAPLLEHLNLAYASSLPFSLQGEITSPIVGLDHVRSITMANFPIDFVASFLRRLSVPRTTCISVNDTWLDERVDNAAWNPESLGPPPLSLRQNFSYMAISINHGYINWTANIPGMTAGVIISGPECWHWMTWAQSAMLLSHVRVLHLHVHDPYTLLILKDFLAKFSDIKELFFLASCRDVRHEEMALSLLQALVPTLAETNPVVCPKLRVLGFETDVHYVGFPFKKLRRAMAARAQAGCPLSRFVYQLHDKRHDNEQSHQLFSASIANLPVALSEYLHLEEERLCPFQLNEGWNTSDTEKYWQLPSRRQVKKPIFAMSCEN